MENKENEKVGNNFNRRAFLGGMVPVAAAIGLPSWATAGEPLADNQNKAAFPGMITREKEPVNLEFPFPTLNSRITPNNQFYIRGHFPIPQLLASSWKLAIDGEVKQEVTFTYDELRKLPSKKVMATLECAGNGRANLAPKVKGLLWEQGGIGNAEWTGVPLSVLLDKAGVKSGAIEIILEGADIGEVTEEPKSPGRIHFARSLPLTKALQAEVIIAYQMNGKDLAPEHGFPVRAIIPGWYGMASVKWLTKITATSTPFKGYWQTLEYAYWQRKEDLPTLTAVTEVLIKAEIARPALHEVVPAGKLYRVYGAAWCGESEVAKVEISTDEGKSWQQAKLLESQIPYTWRLWEFNWQVPAQAGKQKLTVRATDKKGNTQPEEHDKDRRTYMINKMAPLEIEVQ